MARSPQPGQSVQADWPRDQRPEQPEWPQDKRPSETPGGPGESDGPGGAAKPGKRRGLRLPATGPAAVAGTAVVLLVGTIVVVGITSKGGTKGGRAANTGQSAPAQATWQQQAVSRLGKVQALRFQGTVLWQGSPVKAAFNVTQAGSATGTLASGRLRADVVVVDGKTYVKAPVAFWESDSIAGRAQDFAGRWTKAPADAFGFDLAQSLGADAIAKRLRSGTPESGTELVAGVSARRATGSKWSYFVTAANPYKLMRVQPQGSGGHPLQVAEITNTAPLFNELRRRTAALKGARDPAVRFRAGTLRFANCNDNVRGCTVVLPVSLPQANGTVPVRALMLAQITASGRRLGTCAGTEVVGQSRSATVTCTVTSAGWRTWMSSAREQPGRHTYAATARVVAQAVSTTDVTRLLAAITREQQSG